MELEEGRGETNGFGKPRDITIGRAKMRVCQALIGFLKQHHVDSLANEIQTGDVTRHTHLSLVSLVRSKPKKRVLGSYTSVAL